MPSPGASSSNGDHYLLSSGPSLPPAPLLPEPRIRLDPHPRVIPRLAAGRRGGAGEAPGGGEGARLLRGDGGARGAGHAEALRGEHSQDRHQRRAVGHVRRTRHRRAGRGNALMQCEMLLLYRRCAQYSPQDRMRRLVAITNSPNIPLLTILEVILVFYHVVCSCLELDYANPREGSTIVAVLPILQDTRNNATCKWLW